MKITKENYQDTATAYSDRIVEVCNADNDVRDKFLMIDSVWDIFGIKEINTKDFILTLFQAGWAIHRAKNILRGTNEDNQ